VKLTVEASLQLLVTGNFCTLHTQTNAAENMTCS